MLSIKRIVAGVMISTLFLTAGCQKKEVIQKNTQSSEDYLRGLKSNMFYVLHNNNHVCDEIYFPYGTFDYGKVAQAPSNTRVLWCKGDEERIPTLYKGDSLIFFTNGVLGEEFTFERFEDLGYSIGFCGLKETVSGRYRISTNPKDKTTYPDGDTDIILHYDNDEVIIDRLGGAAVRATTDNDSLSNTFLSRCGTLKGLTKDNIYETDIYEGTILHDGLKFKADVWVLGSMELFTSHEYTFEDVKNIINVTLPDWLQSGYYLINGLGLFRYVNATSIDDVETFNAANEPPENV